jgi:excinuclease UvrABC nuclease subunit
MGVYISEPIRLRRLSEDFECQLSRFGHVAGVYVLRSRGTPLHLSWSTNLERRLRRLLLSSYRGSISLGEKLDEVECWPCGSKLELQLSLYTLARRIYPEKYLKFLKLRLPWCIGLTSDPFPRLETTNRLHNKFRRIWGPFPSRAAAQQYQDEVLGLFQIRRCTEMLAPRRDHPGCIYGEMSQCLRPCQEAVSREEYSAEVSRVHDFLHSNGRTALALLTSARDRACDEAEFEQAAQMHKRIERLKAAAGERDPVVDDLDQFHGLALTRSLNENSLFLWPMFGGFWQEPVSLALSGNQSEPKSLDTQLRELVSERLRTPRQEGNRAEELAVFARWFFSSWRDGEWFPFTTLANLSYRRLIREVSKLAHHSCPSTRN